MAKMTKKQEQQYLNLLTLHHEMIRAKHFNDKKAYEAVIEKMKKELSEDE